MTGPVMAFRRSYSVQSSDSCFGFGMGRPFILPCLISRSSLVRGCLNCGRIGLIVTRSEIRLFLLGHLPSSRWAKYL